MALRSKTIVFGHANGFPSGTYRQLFEVWQQAGYRVLAPPMLGHNPAYRVTSNWPHIRDELLHFIEQQAPQQAVHLVGHSLGGYASVLAASRKPALAASVVLIDSPLVGGWRAHSLHMGKLSGLMNRMSPGHVSQRRRWQWPSAAAAYQHFAAKVAFARWAPGVLADYIACGTEPDPDQPGQPDAVRLAFKRDIETRFYNTLPHHLQGLLHKHPLRCPVHFFGAHGSREVRLAGMALTRALTQGTHGRITWLEGSHLFPMEKPLATAQAVLAALQSQAQQTTG
jgi:pimeloyl-ACP methyl ester carboxylesterase